MNKYEELTKALIKAKDIALIYANSEDGGTCNFDNPAITYKGMKKSLVIKAIEAAELRAFDWKLGENYLVISSGCFGQGNRRTRMAVAMTESLKSSGYQAITYYQMD